jgi:hypothetical protein
VIRLAVICNPVSLLPLYYFLLGVLVLVGNFFFGVSVCHLLAILGLFAYIHFLWFSLLKGITCPFLYSDHEGQARVRQP